VQIYLTSKDTALFLFITSKKVGQLVRMKENNGLCLNEFYIKNSTPLTDPAKQESSLKN